MNAKRTTNTPDVLNKAVHDDTEVDLAKVMNRLQVDRELDRNFEQRLQSKMTDYNDLRQLLKTTNLIAEAICEEGREFDPNAPSYFVPMEAIDYATVEWCTIKHTSLGRRLTAYFD